MKRNYDDSGTTAAMNRPQGVRDEDQSGKSGMDKEEMMKKAEAAGKPGPAHKAPEHFGGDWKAGTESVPHFRIFFGKRSASPITPQHDGKKTH